MDEWFLAIHPTAQALLAGLGTWAITAVGAAIVFFRRRIDQRLLDGMLGFAAGVMLAASYWSLLAPAIAISARISVFSWLPPAVGFALGGTMMWVLDKTLPHLHVVFPLAEAEGPKTAWRRATLLVIAITLHNIPEGLAVGVAFGGVVAGLPATSVSAAIALSIGIGIQNLVLPPLFEVFQTSPIAQRVISQVEHMIGFVVRQMELEEVQSLIDLRG